MLKNIIDKMNEPVMIASLSGAIIYAIVQHSFDGVKRLLAFVASFIMGIAGSNVTMNILSDYLPEGIKGDASAGAFICSATIVTATMRLITYSEGMSMKNKRDGHE